MLTLKRPNLNSSPWTFSKTPDAEQNCAVSCLSPQDLALLSQRDDKS